MRKSKVIAAMLASAIAAGGAELNRQEPIQQAPRGAPVQEESDPIGDTLRADAVAYWKMDEASGTRVDATGNGNDASVIQGIPEGISGKIGDAVRFVSDDSDSLQVPTNSGVSIGNGSIPYSWIFWARNPVFSPISSWISKSSDQDDGKYEYNIVPNDDIDDTMNIQFSIGDGDDGTFKGVQSEYFSINQWHFFICVYDPSSVGSELQVSVDNGSVATAATSGAVPYTQAGNLYFGAFGSVFEQFFATVDLDEVLFVKRSLTSDERAYLYNSGAGRTLYP